MSEIIPQKRHILLIDKKFQFSLLGFFLFLSLTAIIIFYLSNAYFLNTFKEQFNAGGLLTEKDMFEFVEDYTIFMDKIFFLTSLFLILSITISGLYLTSRIAGPIYHLTKYLYETKSLEGIKPLESRMNDFFPELIYAFNIFLTNIQKDPNK